MTFGSVRMPDEPSFPRVGDRVVKIGTRYAPTVMEVAVVRCVMSNGDLCMVKWGSRLYSIEHTTNLWLAATVPEDDVASPND